jgi:hypothetical protein
MKTSEELETLAKKILGRRDDENDIAAGADVLRKSHDLIVTLKGRCDAQEQIITTLESLAETFRIHIAALECTLASRDREIATWRGAVERMTAAMSGNNT